MRNHITQTVDDGDCGVACIAMEAEVPYERVMQSVPPDVCQYGLWLPEILHALKKITGNDYALVTYNKGAQQLSRFELPVKSSILGVTRLEAGNTWHYVFTDGEFLYDPLLPDKITLEQAKTDYHSGWIVVALITKVL